MASQPEPSDAAVRCQQLVAKLCDGRLSTAEAAELEALVCGDDGLCRYYIRMVSQQADLHMQAVMLSRDVPESVLDWRRPAIADARPGEEPVYGLSFDPDAMSLAADDDPPHARLPIARPTLPARSRWFERPLTWAAAGLIGLVIAGLFVHPGRPKQVAMPTPRPHPPATTEPGRPAPAPVDDNLLASADYALNPVWGSTGAPPAGSRLPIGPIELRSGIARLTLANGVDLVLEGPARVRRIDRGQTVLDVGRATVRAAHQVKGYTVVTPTASVVDLGTEFGVAVAPADAKGVGATQTLVFDGSVHVAGRSPAASGATLVLNKDQACAVASGADPVAATPKQVGPFCRLDDVERRRRRIERDRLAIGQPGVLAAYLFDEDRGGGRLPGTLPWRSTAGPSKVSVNVDGDASALVLSDLSAAFLDLDASASGRLAAKGFVRRDGTVGSDGHALYVSWSARAIRWVPEQFGGLSLTIGDRATVDEAIFVGQPYQQRRFGAKLRNASASMPGTVIDLDVDPAQPGVQPLAVDGREHRYVMRLDFSPGSAGDRATVYLDPRGTAEPDAAAMSAVLPHPRFDRVRMASGPGCTWTFSNVLVGDSYRAVALPPAE